MKKSTRIGAIVGAAIATSVVASDAFAHCDCGPQRGKPGVTYSQTNRTFESARRSCRINWNAAMRRAGYKQSQLDGICVTKGTGSWAGRKTIQVITDGRETSYKKFGF